MTVNVVSLLPFTGILPSFLFQKESITRIPFWLNSTELQYWISTTRY